jgi:sortase A
MVDTAEGTAPEPAAPGRPDRTWGDRARFVLRGLGQLLITLGVIVALFVVYEVYVTNYFSHQAQQKVQHALHQQWVQDVQQGKRDPLLPLPGNSGPSLPDGQGIAFLYIPRLGSDYGQAIVEGTSDADLEKGPGHYTWSQLPGQKGNFAVAGHRVGKGEPFLNLDHLQSGDAVIVQTESQWFVYRVMGPAGDIEAPDRRYHDVPGREIVEPSDGAVTDPVPDHPGLAPTRALLTMTTCNPKFTAQNRMVVHAMLAHSVPALSGKDRFTMPDSIRHTYYPVGGS